VSVQKGLDVLGSRNAQPEDLKASSSFSTRACCLSIRR
jgi:hypothetical protein